MWWLVQWVLSSWIVHVLLSFVLGSLATLGCLYLALQGKLGSRLNRYERQFEELRTITEDAMERGSNALKRKASRLNMKGKGFGAGWKGFGAGEDGSTEPMAPRVSIEPIVPVQTDAEKAQLTTERALTSDCLVTERETAAEGETTGLRKRKRRASDIGRIQATTQAEEGKGAPLRMSSPAGSRKAPSCKKGHTANDGEESGQLEGEGVAEKTSGGCGKMASSQKMKRNTEEKKRRRVYTRSVAIVTRRKRNGHKRTTSASAPISAVVAMGLPDTTGGTGGGHLGTTAAVHGLAEMSARHGSFVRSPSSPSLSEISQGERAESAPLLIGSEGGREWAMRREAMTTAAVERSASAHLSRESSKKKKRDKEMDSKEKDWEKVEKEREKERERAEKEREKAEREREKERERAEKEKEKAEKRRERDAEKALKKVAKKTKKDGKKGTAVVVDETDGEGEGEGEESEEGDCAESQEDVEGKEKKGKCGKEKAKKKGKKVKKAKMDWVTCEVSDWCPELANSSAFLSKTDGEGEGAGGGGRGGRGDGDHSETIRGSGRGIQRERSQSYTETEPPPPPPTTTATTAATMTAAEDELRSSSSASAVRPGLGRDIDRQLQQRFLEAPLIHCGWMKIKTSLRRFRYRWFAVKAGIVAVYARPFFDTGLLNATAIMLLTPDCSVCYKISRGGEFRLSVRSPQEKMFAPRGFTGARLTGYETSMLSNKKKHCKLALQSHEKGKAWASAIVRAIQTADEMEEVVAYLRTRKVGPASALVDESKAPADLMRASSSMASFSDVSSDTHATTDAPTKAKLPKGLMSQVMMSGWLKLETAATHGSEVEWVWIKRWCIVYKGIVVVFTSPDAKECSAMINLWNCSLRAAPELAPVQPPKDDDDSDDESDTYLSLEEEEESDDEGEYLTDDETEAETDTETWTETATETDTAAKTEAEKEGKAKKKKKGVRRLGVPKKLKKKKKSKAVGNEAAAEGVKETAGKNGKETKTERKEAKRREREEREERKRREKEEKTRQSSLPDNSQTHRVTATTEKSPRESEKERKKQKTKGKKKTTEDSEEEDSVEPSRVFELLSSDQTSGDVGQLIKKLPDFNRAAQYQIHEALCRYQSQTGVQPKSLGELVDEADPVPTKDKFSKFTKKGSAAEPLGHKVTIDGDRDQRLLRFLAPSVGEARRWLDALASAASVNYWEFPLEFSRLTSKAREAEKESANWLNVFLDRYFAEMVNSKRINEKMFNWIQRKLDQLKKPDILGPIVVQNVDLGTSLLRTTGICLQAHKGGKELVGECDVVYEGGASVHLFTEVYLNWPTKQFISVPVEATVTMSYASGKLGLYVPPLFMGRATVSFLELPNTVFNTNVDIGGSKRYNVASLFPQITEFLQTSMQKLVWKTLVMPNRMTFALGIPENSASLRLDRVASRPKGQAAQHAAPESS